MRIILDAMGGDNAPDANIKGAVNAINKVKAEVRQPFLIAFLQHARLRRILHIKICFACMANAGIMCTTLHVSETKAAQMAWWHAW